MKVFILLSSVRRKEKKGGSMENLTEDTTRHTCSKRGILVAAEKDNESCQLKRT